MPLHRLSPGDDYGETEYRISNFIRNTEFALVLFVTIVNKVAEFVTDLTVFTLKSNQIYLFSCDKIYEDLILSRYGVDTSEEG